MLTPQWRNSPQTFGNLARSLSLHVGEPSTMVILKFWHHPVSHVLRKNCYLSFAREKLSGRNPRKPMSPLAWYSRHPWFCLFEALILVFVLTCQTLFVLSFFEQNGYREVWQAMWCDERLDLTLMQTSKSWRIVQSKCTASCLNLGPWDLIASNLVPKSFQTTWTSDMKRSEEPKWFQSSHSTLNPKLHPKKTPDGIQNWSNIAFGNPNDWKWESTLVSGIDRIDNVASESGKAKQESCLNSTSFKCTSLHEQL